MGRPHLVCQLSAPFAPQSQSPPFSSMLSLKTKIATKRSAQAWRSIAFTAGCGHRMLAEGFLYLTTCRPTLKTLVFALLYARYIEPNQPSALTQADDSQVLPDVRICGHGSNRL